MALPIPPVPGSAGPGDLYVDLQSKTLWLGVAASVDPALAVLISDIDGVSEQDAETLAAAGVYTDSRVATRAPTVHTHTASQITDFNAAVQAVIVASPDAGGFARGMIIMWSGLISDIGIGPLAGWSLCDGSNGTPNLRDRFIIGAGNKLPGAIDGGIGLAISGGTHVHTINSTALTIAEMPGHTHGGVTGTETANHTHTFVGVTDAQGNHVHGIRTNTNTSAGDEGVRGGNTGAGPNVTQNTEVAGNHQHNFSGTTHGMSNGHAHSIPSQGGGQGHTHTIVGGGGIHEHAVTPAQLREAIPYFALAYIMKL